MSPQQEEQLLKAIEEIEGWAAGLLSKCTLAKTLIQQAGVVSTKPSDQHKGLSPRQFAEISAKQRARMLKKK